MWNVVGKQIMLISLISINIHVKMFLILNLTFLTSFRWVKTAFKDQKCQMPNYWFT